MGCCDQTTEDKKIVTAFNQLAIWIEALIEITRYHPSGESISQCIEVMERIVVPSVATINRLLYDWMLEPSTECSCKAVAKEAVPEEKTPDSKSKANFELNHPDISNVRILVDNPELDRFKELYKLATILAEQAIIKKPTTT